MSARYSPEPTIQDVRRFWTESPLFSGEGQHNVGTREWFVEHEQVYTDDCFAGRAPDIFSRGVTPGTRLLDAGCGPGFWVRFFSRLGVRDVTACDLTTMGVGLTRHSLQLFGLAAKTHVANIEQLPYRAGSFDHVNCQGVVHHTVNPAAALREFRRVLRPGGTLCFSVYHRNVLLRHPGWLRALRGVIAPFVSLRGRGREDLLATANADEIVRMYDGRDNPIGRAYTVNELTTMVVGCFAVEEVAFFYFPARVLPFALWRPLHRWLSQRHGLMVILRCRAISGEFE
jgi:SAM-dependent methyltransferase